MTLGTDMEERYRRPHYDPNLGPFWTPPPTKVTTVVNGRPKKHLPVFPRKKSSKDKPIPFDMSTYLKSHKDKYGSVSAHSTSAIYGALRAPHFHSMYSPSDVWYSSVRSLNSRQREILYPIDVYEWSESAREDLKRDGRPPELLHLRAPCICMIRRRNISGSKGSHSSGSSPKCKYCVTTSSSVPSQKKVSSDKLKLLAVSEENGDETNNVISSADRMAGYKKRMIGSSRPSKMSKHNKSKSQMAPSPCEKGGVSRKSILECDITAYDLIKKGKLTPPATEVDSDEDDELTDNVVKRTNTKSKLNKNEKIKTQHNSMESPQPFSPGLRFSSSKSQIESKAYTETSSVRLGGQKIFTKHQHSTSCTNSTQPVKDHCETTKNKDSWNWRKFSSADDSICIPEPDYDYSDDSDNSFRNHPIRSHRFTFSPPLIRRSISEQEGNELCNLSSEISRSMSSLHSEEHLTTEITATNSNLKGSTFRTNDSVPLKSDAIKRNVVNIADDLTDLSRHDGQREQTPIRKDRCSQESYSSSDSSNCGTLSSDYPTWTSSSSGELKSILKNKKNRETPVVQETNYDSPNFVVNAKEFSSTSKKQVQFRSTGDDAIFPPESASCDENEYAEINNLEAKYVAHNGETIVHGSESVIENRDMCQQGNYVLHDKRDNLETHDSVFDKSSYRGDSKSSKTENDDSSFFHFESPTFVENANPLKTSEPSIKNFPPEINHFSPRWDETQTSDIYSNLTLTGRSSSLEDIRDVSRKTRASKRNDGSRRRRTTLPKRRFSDLHLHILLCPKRSALCGDNSSSDDIPLTEPRGHRSLPESPSGLEDESTFCFDFLEKPQKDKCRALSRSKFYVSVDDALVPRDQNSLPASPSGDETSCPCVSEDDQLSEVEDTDDVLGVRSPIQVDTDEDNLENEYENLEPIYEELSDISNESSKRLPALDSPLKSFFEGASKTDILSYLKDAKERGLEGLSEDESKAITEEEEEEEEDDKTRSEPEKPKEKSPEQEKNDLNHDSALAQENEEIASANLEITTEVIDLEILKTNRSSSAEVERNDSGVGTETSKPSKISKLHMADSEEQLCADCDHQVEPLEDEVSGLLFNPLVCKKCDLRRCERKEIIIEFVDTELKYGRDLRIIKEEFCRPMEIAGLLGKEQLFSVFLNLDELIAVNTKFAEKLQDGLDIAMEHGDEDYTTVNIGKLFLETSSMLHAFETYCVRQAQASVLLNHLEKEKELLRIFLRVSQMENTLLRRMNLPAFLMVPVQRVTRYPLLLCRLHKVTPIHHKDREVLREAQQKVELHLEHINQQTKGVGGTKIWRRISNISASHRRLGNLQDIGNIKLRKMALEVLNWKQDEVRFVLAGKLLFAPVTDYPWNKKGKALKFSSLHALLITLGKPNANYRPESAAEVSVHFPRNTGIRDASLLLMKEKNGRFITCREPLYLGNCIISSDSEDDDFFEIQEYTTKEAYLLKGENTKDTKEWLRQLRYHAKDLGSWRRRRNALANIMINGMIRQ